MKLKLWLLFSAGILTLKNAHAERRHHGAHEHGAASLNIAVEKSTIELELDSPAESIYGFEHEAKTAEEKKAQSDAFTGWKSNALAILGLPADLGCKITKASAEVEAEHHDDDDHDHHEKTGEKHHDKAGHKHDEKKVSKSNQKTEAHADVEATATIVCNKPIVAGTKFNIDPTKVFAKIKSIKVQLIGGSTQKGATLTKFPGSLAL